MGKTPKAGAELEKKHKLYMKFTGGFLKCIVIDRTWNAAGALLRDSSQDSYDKVNSNDVSII